MPQATMAECPKCGAKVRQEKLRRHISGVHGDIPRVRKAAPQAAKVATVTFPWMMFLAIAAAAALVVGGYWVSTHALGGGGTTTTGKRIAVMETNYGTIKIELDLGRAPITAGHFVSMVNGGIYNPNSIHRVAANFVVQGGANGQATGVNWENTGLKNVRYSISMARSGSPNNQADANTATSQFFINLKDNPSLDSPAVTYPYVVFGRVIEGQSVVDAIGALYPPTQPNYDGAPTATVTITRAYMQS